jgi:aryl-alcohol dehydrogenase-like predicted oxidoreductase
MPHGVGDEIVIATKLGARPLAPGTSFTDNAEGLSAGVIRESSQRSRDRLGMSRLDLPYAHIDDPAVPLAETVEAFAYSPLLKGAYARPGKLDAPEFAEFRHPGTPARLAVLREVARDTGATVNQVVLAWLIGAEVPVIPLIGASSVAQLDESLAAVDLELTAEQRARLDAAG